MMATRSPSSMPAAIRPFATPVTVFANCDAVPFGTLNSTAFGDCSAWRKTLSELFASSGIV
ncbi:Uncharacterised protein [Mycobacteroides abscessus subsp. abscessus]|nr:Uncharacterised protein [Mycobacteroides abscessus subsp. abscessus]